MLWLPATEARYDDRNKSPTVQRSQNRKGRSVSAQAALQKTRAQSVCERAETLRRISDEIGKRREDFVRCIVNETGKPVTFAETEVARAQSTFLLASEEARRVSGDVLSMEAFPAGKGHSGFTRRFPIGIVYGLTPFNFPLNLAAHKVAPALAASTRLA